MWVLLGISFLYIFPAFADDADWKNHNCPAPRSPSNGISFIFHDGALVRYRCHPGYVMRGRAYARCLKNKWDSRTPLCIRRNGMEEFVSKTSYTTMPKRGQHYTSSEISSTSRSLFDWEKSVNTPPYGDGPNRLPVINGIWKTSARPSINLFTIGSDNVAKDLIREEIGIAEVRQRQLEEVQRTRDGYKTIPKYSPVENLRVPTKPRYHGSISVVVLPSEAENQRLDITTTKRPNKRRNGKKQRGKNRKDKSRKGKNSSKEFRHKPEGRIKSQDRPNYPSTNYNSVHQRNSRPYHPPPYSRPSRDQVMEDTSSSQYDNTCYEVMHGRKIPLRAPPVANAFVYKYDSRKHYSNPDSYYLIVHYKCRHGFTLRNIEANKLYCKNGSWVGETPLCEP